MAPRGTGGQGHQRAGQGEQVDQHGGAQQHVAAVERRPEHEVDPDREQQDAGQEPVQSALEGQPTAAAQRQRANPSEQCHRRERPDVVRAQQLLSQDRGQDGHQRGCTRQRAGAGQPDPHAPSLGAASSRAQAVDAGEHEDPQRHGEHQVPELDPDHRKQERAGGQGHEADRRVHPALGDVLGLAERVRIEAVGRTRAERAPAVLATRREDGQGLGRSVPATEGAEVHERSVGSLRGLASRRYRSGGGTLEHFGPRQRRPTDGARCLPIPATNPGGAGCLGRLSAKSPRPTTRNSGYLRRWTTHYLERAACGLGRGDSAAEGRTCPHRRCTRPAAHARGARQKRPAEPRRGGGIGSDEAPGAAIRSTADAGAAPAR